MKKKVLLLADINSSHTRKWAEGVNSLGYEVAVFSLSAPADGWYTRPGIRLLSGEGVDNKKFAGSDVSKLSYLKVYSALRKAISSFSPAIVHAHYATSYGLLGAMSGRHPFIVSAWGSDVFDFPRRSFIHRNILQWIFRKADVILSTSRIMADEMSKYTGKKVRITPFGVDTTVFTPMPKTASAAFTIGIIKKLEPHYGIDYLIKAFKSVTGKFPGKSLQLIITGDGYMMDEYRRLVVSLDLTGKVIFTGRIPQDEVPAMHNKFDLFVCPSLHESFGVSVLEASACGVPVIASNTGGLPEVVVSGETGLLVKPADVNELADAISFFISNPEELKTFGNHGRKFVCDNYEWKNNLSQIDDIYRHL